MRYVWTCYRDNRGCQYWTDQKPVKVESMADVIVLADRRKRRSKSG